jgi:hypothetical protein
LQNLEETRVSWLAASHAQLTEVDFKNSHDQLWKNSTKFHLDSYPTSSSSLPHLSTIFYLL